MTWVMQADHAAPLLTHQKMPLGLPYSSFSPVASSTSSSLASGSPKSLCVRGGQVVYEDVDELIGRPTQQLTASPLFGGVPPMPVFGAHDECRLREDLTAGAFNAAAPRLKFGAHTLQGHKRFEPGWVNQDAFVMLPLSDDRLFVAVCDGHGANGHHASRKVCTVFSQLVPTLANLQPAMVPQALTELFKQSHAALEADGMFDCSGTTCTVALIDTLNNVMTVAHVGDSTLVLSKGEGVIFETDDHKFNAEAFQRIRTCGGEVIAADGATRVFSRTPGAPGLAMSRALGDCDVHSVGVVSEPDVKGGLPFHPGNTLIVASDGLWDMVPKSAAPSFVKGRTPEEGARALVSMSESLWGGVSYDRDDISVLVVSY